MPAPQSNEDVSRIRTFVNEQYNKLSNEILCDVWDVAAETERMRALWAGWQPIETAPKGLPANSEPSEWFLAYGTKYRGPVGGKIAVIRRVFNVGFGPWECTGDANYKEDFFSHWMPLPPVPRNMSALEQTRG